MEKDIELPEGMTKKDVRINWNYQMWGLYHNALIEINELSSKRKDKFSKEITKRIAAYRDEMADYNRFFTTALDLADD